MFGSWLKLRDTRLIKPIKQLVEVVTEEMEAEEDADEEEVLVDEANKADSEESDDKDGMGAMRHLVRYTALIQRPATHLTLSPDRGA